MPLASRNYWIERGVSGANAALVVAHVVPALQQSILQYLYISASDGGDSWAWEFECPSATAVLEGYGAVLWDFGLEGFVVPQLASGDDLRLDVAAAGGTATTRVIMIGVDVTAT